MRRLVFAIALLYCIPVNGQMRGINPTTGLWDGYTPPYVYSQPYTTSYQYYPTPYRSEYIRSGPVSYGYTRTPYSYQQSYGLHLNSGFGQGPNTIITPYGPYRRRR